MALLEGTHGQKVCICVHFQSNKQGANFPLIANFRCSGGAVVTSTPSQALVFFPPDGQSSHPLLLEIGNLSLPPGEKQSVSHSGSAWWFMLWCGSRPEIQGLSTVVKFWRWQCAPAWPARWRLHHGAGVGPAAMRAAQASPMPSTSSSPQHVMHPEFLLVAVKIRQ